MSGAFDIKSFMDGLSRRQRVLQQPRRLPGRLNDHELWNMDIILGTSNWDICLDSNLKLSRVLAQRDIPHWLDIRQDQQHDWPDLAPDVSALFIKNQIFLKY